jgi:hypothetical protein
MCHAFDQLAVLIKPIPTNRYTDLFDHRGIPMQTPVELDMSFSLVSFMAPIGAIVIGMLIVLALDWRRNGG